MHEIDAYARIWWCWQAICVSLARRSSATGTSAEHPSSLLPSIGLHTHRQVLENGDEEHGTSVHFVTDELDGGPVILQAKVPVFAGDSEEEITARVQAGNMPFIRWSSAGSSMDVCAWQATTRWMSDSFPGLCRRRMNNQPRMCIAGFFN